MQQFASWEIDNPPKPCYNNKLYGDEKKNG